MASRMQQSMGLLTDMLDEQRRIRDLISWYEGRVLHLEIAIQEQLLVQVKERETGIRTTEVTAEEQGPPPAPSSPQKT